MEREVFERHACLGQEELEAPQFAKRPSRDAVVGVENRENFPIVEHRYQDAFTRLGSPDAREQRWLERVQVR